MAERETKNVMAPYQTVKPIEDRNQEDRVDATHPKHDQWMQYSYLTRSLMQGTRGMREAGEAFLPKFELETQARYNSRLLQSILKNAYRKTVSFLSGQVFQSDLGFTDEFPDQLEPMHSDVDLLGSTVEVFSKRCFSMGIADGVSHILVEAPAEEPGDTRQDDLDSGLRPYFKIISGTNLIGWQADEESNLTQVRILQILTEPDGRFGQKFIPEITVLEPGYWQKYRKDDSNSYIPFDEGDSSLDYIPLVTFMPGDEVLSLLTAESPLQDLADLNLHHWQSSSDQKNILHVGRIPILFGKDVDLDKFVVGSSKAITSQSADADLKFVEITGAAIEAGANDLKETEAAMALYGLQQMIPRTGTQTATEKALSAAESNSSLATWVNEYQDTITRAYAIAADYMGIDQVEKGMVSMPTDFDKFIADPQMISALISMVDKRMISKQEAFETVNQMGILRDGVTWEQILDEVENESRSSAGAGPLAGLGGLFRGQGATE